MTDERLDVTGIVLAGGRSRRYGRDKLAEPVDGVPLLHHPILRLAGLCREVIVARPASGELPPLPRTGPGWTLRTTTDPLPDGGPVVGLLAALEGATYPLAVVVGGDMPSLVPSVLARMIAWVAADDGVDACVLGDGDGDVARPLPAVLRVAAVKHRGSTTLDTGDRSIRGLLGTLRVGTLAPAAWRPLDPAGLTLRDVDVPGDLTAR